MNMEASRLHLAKAGDLKLVVGCAGIAERERDRIGSSMGGRVSGRRGRRAIRRRPVVHRRVSRRGRGGGGIHRCGSLRADDCGLIDRRRAVFSRDVLRLKERRRRHERLIRVDFIAKYRAVSRLRYCEKFPLDYRGSSGVAWLFSVLHLPN